MSPLPSSIVPPKLSVGDHLRIIAPSRSMALLSDDVREAAKSRLETFGFRVSYGEHVFEHNDLMTSSVASRLEDMHAAFSDQDVDGILTVIGGYSSNQLLSGLDFDLIGKHPKVLCGFSDITTLSNAVYARTGVVGYSGPHFSSWGMRHGFEFSLEHFVHACMGDTDFELCVSESWSDDPWYLDQEHRAFEPNEGPWVFHDGAAEGTLIGGNGSSFGVLLGTEYRPRFHDTVFFLEVDAEQHPATFDRLVQNLILQPDFSQIRALLVGRFQRDSRMTRDILERIIGTKPELRGIPIVANLDFGHTTPCVTIPIGGAVRVEAHKDRVTVTLLAQ